MTTITRANLYPCFNAGTPNNRQLAMFGMKWPLSNGWAKQMLGRSVPDDFLPRLAALRKVKGTPSLPKPAKTSPKPRIVRSMEFTDDAGSDMVHLQIDLTVADAAKLTKFLGCSISR